MESRCLGRNGPMLSAIGFGAWAIGGSGDWGWGPQDDASSIEAIHRALDVGITWIDTAPVYGLGHSEELVARALKGRRDRVFVATKCGTLWDNCGNYRRSLEPASIRLEVEASLRRLRVDVVDLYQCHWPDPQTPVEVSWETMAALQDEGKVRYIGVSNFDIPLLERCLAIRHVDALQPPYSLLKRDIEQSVLALCEENGIGVLAYSPLQSGLLTGRFAAARLAEDDWRRRKAYFSTPLLEKNLAFVDRLRPIARRHGKTVGQLAIAWVLRHLAIASAIVGARRPEQVDENIGGVGWQLAPEELAQIDQALAETGAHA